MRIVIALGGLILGLLAWAAGRADVANWIWAAGTAPVIICLLTALVIVVSGVQQTSSNTDIALTSDAFATDALKASGAISSPWMRTRSAQREKWGETQAPAPTPCASSRAAVIWTTEDLPLVPTTCTEPKRCWGIPRRLVSRCIRSSPSFQPIGCNEPR